MCKRVYAFCRGCNSFYPSRSRARITKRQCVAFPNCKETRLLIDTRHEGCKERKTGWFGFISLFGKKTDNKKKYMPLNEKTSAKVKRLEEHRREKREKQKQEVRVDQDNRSSWDPLEYYLNSNRNDDEEQLDDGECFELPEQDTNLPHDRPLSSVYSDQPVNDFDSEQAPAGLKSYFWTTMSLGEAYRNVLPEREF